MPYTFREMRRAACCFSAGLILSLTFSQPAVRSAEPLVIHGELTHLRSGEQREWTSFPETASGSSLTVDFQSEANTEAATLGLRRIDVKEGWRVTLNDHLLGNLFSDENDMQEIWEIPAGELRTGLNQVKIEPTSQKVDDIHIGEIWLDHRPKSEVLNESTLKLVAVDGQNRPLPCRFTIQNQHGTLVAVGAESNDNLAVRSGVVYCASGTAEIGLPVGTYTISCGRGFEYSLGHRSAVLHPGDDVQLEFELSRVVDTRGLVACDPHVHTFEVSRHGDASLVERMITLAGEGIELPVATDHNVFVDYRPVLEQLGLQHLMTPVVGNEVTTKYGHFNIFPAEPDADIPNFRAENWDELMEDVFGTPNVRVAILNHPRDVHSGFEPFGSQHMLSAVGSRLDGRRLRANAIELVNSAALQSDPMLVFHDWLTQWNRGVQLTPMGSSDSHEVSRKIVGQGRTYVYVDDSTAGDIDVDAAVDAIVDGRVLVSFGLLTELTVGDKARAGELYSPSDDSLSIKVQVQGPEWVHAEEVALYANGELIRSHRLNAQAGSQAGVKYVADWSIPVPPHDVHLVALALGQGVDALYWPIAKPYQPTSTEWKSYTLGASGVVRIDADGDGQWTPAAEYAAQAVTAAEGDVAKLVGSLQTFDTPTAAFAVHQWLEQGSNSLHDESLLQALEDSTPAFQAGYERYSNSLRATLTGSEP